MTKLLCSHELLSEKSKETGISFSGLLGGAVLEEIVRRIGASEYKETLWLRNEQVMPFQILKTGTVFLRWPMI